MKPKLIQWEDAEGGDEDHRRGIDALGLPWIIVPGQKGACALGPSDIYGDKVESSPPGMSVDDAMAWCQDKFNSVILSCLE